MRDKTVWNDQTESSSVLHKKSSKKISDSCNIDRIESDSIISQLRYEEIGESSESGENSD